MLLKCMQFDKLNECKLLNAARKLYCKVNVFKQISCHFHVVKVGYQNALFTMLSLTDDANIK